MLESSIIGVMIIGINVPIFGKYQFSGGSKILKRGEGFQWHKQGFLLKLSGTSTLNFTLKKVVTIIPPNSQHAHFISPKKKVSMHSSTSQHALESF